MNKDSSLTIEDLKKMMKKAIQNYPLEGYIAADYYDGENVYFYKPEPLIQTSNYSYKIDWDKIK